MSVTLTEAAAKHVQKYLARRGKGVEPDDKVWESFGVKVLVDEKSLPYLDGTELDYTREGLQEGFKFHNPNEKSRCGCGESFHV